MASSSPGNGHSSETGNRSHVYAIFDSVAEYFLPPFFAINDGQARRMFVVGLGDSFPHRADFTLFRIGSWNDATAELTAEAPAKVLSGVSIAPSLDPRPKPALPEEKVQ